MIHYPFSPKDCCAETLFPEAEKLLIYPPFGFALQTAGPLGYFKIPYWDLALDPLEENKKKPDGTIDHDNYICLCKWLDGSPISVRYNKKDVYRKNDGDT